MRRFAHRAALLLVMSASGLAGAQSTQSVSHSEIGPGTLAGAHGNAAINSSAGMGNAQSNMAAISVATESAGAILKSRQQATRPGAAAHAQRAVIAGNAFAGSSGIVVVNQSSGSGNAQANLVAVAAGRFAEVAIDHLGTVHASNDGAASEPTPAADRQHRAVVSDAAFAGTSGIVQVNQLAGSGNSTANTFALSVGTPMQ